MKIVFDNIVFSLQKSGGISVVWYELLKRMQDNKSFDLLFLEYKGASHNIFRNKIRIDTVSQKNQPLSLVRYFNPRLSSLNEPFIFHSSYYRTSTNKHAINITTVHDFIYEKFRSGIRKRIHCLQKRRAIENSDYIICVSENTKNDLLELYPKIDKRIVFVAPNGCSESYTPQHENSVSQSRFEKSKYLIYVGNRDEYKRFDLAVATAANLNLGLVIVGDKLNDYERKMIAEKLTENQFQVFQNIPSSELNHLYSNALCLIYPSMYEGFGIPILEAQNAGCPVLAHNGGAMKEVIGKTPLLFDDFHADELTGLIKRYLFDSTSRNEIIEKGFLNSKKYSWDNTYKQIEKIYTTILERQRNK